MFHALGRADILLIFLSNWIKNFFKTWHSGKTSSTHGPPLTPTRPGDESRCGAPACGRLPPPAPSSIPHCERPYAPVCNTTPAHLSSVGLTLPSHSLAPLGAPQGLSLRMASGNRLIQAWIICAWPCGVPHIWCGLEEVYQFWETCPPGPMESILHGDGHGRGKRAYL